MSLATCRECEAFIDTDADPAACVDDDFVCESCRDVFDESLYQQVRELNIAINELTSKNKKLIEALKVATCGCANALTLFAGREVADENELFVYKKCWEGVEVSKKLGGYECWNNYL